GIFQTPVNKLFMIVVVVADKIMSVTSVCYSACSVVPLLSHPERNGFFSLLKVQHKPRIDKAVTSTC
ncbi:hypothetical protein, partial [Mucilaginibacter sp.]|uniref:hypothetical protein n=1 Tax=Mucilaginibacter sp. TaxID=1882438 RepID=UPI000CABE46E